MVCCFVYNLKVFNFQISHWSDFNRKLSICWNRTGHQFQRVEIGSVANFGDGNRKSKSAFRLKCHTSMLTHPGSISMHSTISMFFPTTMQWSIYTSDLGVRFCIKLVRFLTIKKLFLKVYCECRLTCKWDSFTAELAGFVEQNIHFSYLKRTSLMRFWPWCKRAIMEELKLTGAKPGPSFQL